MEHHIRKIIQRNLKLPDFALPTSLELNRDDSFHLKLQFLNETERNLSKSHFKLLFTGKNIIISHNERKVELYNTFNLNDFFEKEDDININNLNVFIELLSSISEYSHNSFSVNIKEPNKKTDLNSYNVLCIRNYIFSLKTDQADLLKKIYDDIVEYYIRDYVIIESGFSIDEKDIKYFVAGFYKTNPKFLNSFFKLNPSSNEFIISDEFKEFLNFKTEYDIKKSIELLKLNFLF